MKCPEGSGPPSTRSAQRDLGTCRPGRVCQKTHSTHGAGARSTVMADLVGPVAPGERVLVHAGVALVRLEEGA